MAKIGGPVAFETSNGTELYWSDDGTPAGNLIPITTGGAAELIETTNVDALYWRDPTGTLTPLFGSGGTPTPTPTPTPLIVPVLSISHTAKTATLTNPEAGVTYGLYIVAVDGAETALGALNADNSFTLDISATAGRHVVCHGVKDGFDPTQSARYLLALQNVPFARDFTTMNPGNLSADTANGGWQSSTSFVIADNVLKGTATNVARHDMGGAVTRFGVRFKKTRSGDNTADRATITVMGDGSGNGIYINWYENNFYVAKARVGLSPQTQFYNSGAPTTWKTASGSVFSPPNGYEFELYFNRTGSTWYVQVKCNGVDQLPGLGWDVTDFFAAIPGIRSIISKDHNGAIGTPSAILQSFEIIDYTNMPICVSAVSYVEPSGGQPAKIRVTGDYVGGMTDIEFAVASPTGLMLTPWNTKAVSGNAFTNLEFELSDAAQSVPGAVLCFRNRADTSKFWQRNLGTTPTFRTIEAPKLGLNIAGAGFGDRTRDYGANWFWETDYYTPGAYRIAVQPDQGTNPDLTFPATAIGMGVLGEAKQFGPNGNLRCTLSWAILGGAGRLPAGRGGSYQFRFVDAVTGQLVTTLTWGASSAAWGSISAPVGGISNVTLNEGVGMGMLVNITGGTFPANGIVPVCTKVGDTAAFTTAQAVSDIQGVTMADGPIRFMTSRYVNHFRRSGSLLAKRPAANRWKGALTGNGSQYPMERITRHVNDLNRPAYVCGTHLDADDLIREEFIIARDGHTDRFGVVHPGLQKWPLYYEVSNETWNWDFWQSIHLRYLGCVDGLYSTNGDAGYNPNIIFAAGGNGLVNAATREILRPGGFAVNDLVFVDISGTGWMVYRALTARAQGTFMPASAGENSDWKLVASPLDTDTARLRYLANRYVAIRAIAQEVFGDEHAEKVKLCINVQTGGTFEALTLLRWNGAWQAVDYIMTAPYWELLPTAGPSLGGSLSSYTGSGTVTGVWDDAVKAKYTTPKDLAGFATGFFGAAALAVTFAADRAKIQADECNTALATNIAGYPSNKIKFGCYESGHHCVWTGWPNQADAREALDYVFEHASMATMYQSYYTQLAQKLGGPICVFEEGNWPQAGTGDCRRWGITRYQGDTGMAPYQGVLAAKAALA